MGAKDMNFDLELPYLFYIVNTELEYIEKSLVFLNQSLSNELEILEKEFIAIKFHKQSKSRTKIA